MKHLKLKHLKLFENFDSATEEQIEEHFTSRELEDSMAYYNKLVESGDLSEIMFIVENSDILDEFPQLSMCNYASIRSECLDRAQDSKTIREEEADFLRYNSITVELYQEGENITKEPIHFVEPKIWKIIQDINVMLSSIGYQIVYNEFGFVDLSYELIITDSSY